MPGEPWLEGENCLVLKPKSAKNIIPVVPTMKTRTTTLLISASLVALSSERMIKEKENSEYIILPGGKKLPEWKRKGFSTGKKWGHFFFWRM